MDDAAQYSSEIENLAELARGVESALIALLDGTVVLHSIPWRVKSQESADRKILASPEAYGGYGDLHDLLGIRVITLFENDLDAAEKAIRRVIKVDPKRSGDRIERYEPNQFGYRSRHFVGRLKSDRSRLPENVRYRGRTIEIQLRSILQHAWAEVEHDLGYKPDRPIDNARKRRFSQLAALMELADQGFSSLRTELTQVEQSERKGYSASAAASNDLSIATLDAFVRMDVKFKAFDRLLALKMKSALQPAGSAPRERIGLLLDLATSVGWRSVKDVADALAEFHDNVVEEASNLSTEQRRLLEVPDGLGLRPGFGLILLVDAARKEMAERE